MHNAPHTLHSHNTQKRVKSYFLLHQQICETNECRPVLQSQVVSRTRSQHQLQATGVKNSVKRTTLFPDSHCMVLRASIFTWLTWYWYSLALVTIFSWSASCQLSEHFAGRSWFQVSCFTSWSWCNKNFASF